MADKSVVRCLRAVPSADDRELARLLREAAEVHSEWVSRLDAYEGSEVNDWRRAFAVSRCNLLTAANSLDGEGVA